jgi:hypothetical protein
MRPILIIGVGKTREEEIDSLVKLEPILAWCGVKDNEGWNNRSVSPNADTIGVYAHLHKSMQPRIYSPCQTYGFEYHNHNCAVPEQCHFLATDLTSIINHLTNYEQ